MPSKRCKNDATLSIVNRQKYVLRGCVAFSDNSLKRNLIQWVRFFFNGTGDWTQNFMLIRWISTAMTQLLETDDSALKFETGILQNLWESKRMAEFFLGSYFYHP